MRRYNDWSMFVFFGFVVLLGFAFWVGDKNKPEAVSTSTSYDEVLTKIANDKLDDLVATGYWAHTNSNGCNYDCRVGQYLNEDMYSWIGENIYRGICSEQSAYDLWEKSVTHKAVLDHESDREVLISRPYDEENCYIILEKAVLSK